MLVLEQNGLRVDVRHTHPRYSCVPRSPILKNVLKEVALKFRINGVILVDRYLGLALRI